MAVTLGALMVGCGAGTVANDAATTDAPVEASPGDAAPEVSGLDATDAPASDAPAPDGGCDRPADGGACTPGRVSCGPAECPSASEYCCITATGPQCLPTAAMCTGGTVELRCDESTDCPSGQVCCSGRGVGRAYQACAAECTRLEIQVCRTNSECIDRTTACTLNDCSGFLVQTCGPLPPASGCTPR